MCDIPDGLADFPLCRPWLEDLDNGLIQWAQLEISCGFV